MVAMSEPVVRSPGLRKLREGKGFSVGELRAAGLTPKEAEDLGLRIDRRRRSVHSWNVELLQRLKHNAQQRGGGKR
jgi:large subunit ribosomal protein L13e